jgi:hypothetical protein
MRAWIGGVCEMTFIEIEDALPDQREELTSATGLTVKCSWCGEIIHLDGQELALAMCQACYERMLAEFLRAQQTKQAPAHASDR